MWIGVLLVGLALVARNAAAAQATPAAAARPIAFVAPIEGMIDLGLAPFVERVLRTAAEERAAVVILEVNTFGGRVDAAVAIRDHLLRSSVPIVAFVNPRAISAGALISLAAHKIAMARGGTIGAATPVQAGGPNEGSKPVDEKTVSYVRKEFRATADARKRPGLIAEAMVDADVEIPDLIAKGKLLTLTTDDALKHGVADLQADSLPQLLTALGHRGAEIRRVPENWAERIVRFLTQPAVASILMSVGLLGLLVELRTPGLGFPGLIGVLSLASFFWGHWLVQLAGWEEVMLVSAGLVLLAVELFALPGFGVAGILGFVALAAGLTSSLFGAGASWPAITVALSRVAISAALALLGMLVLLRFLPAFPGSRRLVLGSALAEGGGEPAVDRLPAGTLGVTLTPLRPAGIATIRGQRVDVVSEGGFIEAGQEIEVIRDDRHRVVVMLRRAPAVVGTDHERS